LNVILARSESGDPKKVILAERGNEGELSA